MADNDQNLSLTEALAELTGAIQEDKRLRVLSSKDASKADKLLMRELKQTRKQANRKPAGVARRVGRRALGGIGGAVGGAIGGAIGSIPIAGTILRVLGQEFRNSRFDKKAYQKTLKQRRKLELKEMDRMSKVKAKLDSRNEQKEEDADPKGPTTNQSVAKLAGAALHLQATAISLTPAIETFHETVAKMSEVVDQMAEQQDDGPKRIRDQKVIEYLHAIDYMTQANAAIGERNEGAISSIDSNISNIKWHTARANGTVGRIEKLMKDGSKVEIKPSDEVVKDIANIKWHVARANGSTGRIEKLLQKAADDRLKMLDNDKQDLKLQQKQVDTQETGNGIGIIGAITNLFGGTGTALAAMGAITLGVGAAAALGMEIGKAISDWIPDNDITNAIQDGFGKAVDRVLAFFGDDDAKARLNMFEAEDNLAKANEIDRTMNVKENDPEAFATRNEAWQQEYAKKHGEYDRKERYILRDPRSNPANPLNHISEPMYDHEYANKKAEYDAIAEQLNRQSAEIEDAKNSQATTIAPNTVNAPVQSNVTNNTVAPQPLNARSDRDAGRNSSGGW